MKLRNAFGLLAVALSASSGAAHWHPEAQPPGKREDRALAGERFVQKVTIQAGLVVVVSEGDLEARSIGSYSVRVYSDPSADAGNETTFYSAGVIRSRDGTVLAVAPLEVPGRKRPLLMVVVQSAGSGGYLSADAFAVEPRSIRLVANVSGLAPTEDPAHMLRRKLAGAAR